MEKTLDIKLKQLAANRTDRAFILADAKDADMAFGLMAPGRDWRRGGEPRSLDDYRDQIREIVHQGLVDIALMSASTSDRLTIHERLFDNSPVTPAVRANDTTEIHLPRGGRYLAVPSRPFASATLDHIQAGACPCADADRTRGADLGLYSVTFNNLPDEDLVTMQAYKAFRLEAEPKKFRHFLEVFDPNVAADLHGLSLDQIPGFINDHITRLLAGVPAVSRPVFLKIVYHGPAAMEELCACDSSLLVGVLGGSAGTTHDAFHLLHDAKAHGARVALFGRKINSAEHQLAFVEHLRRVADDQLKPVDAVKSYHAALAKMSITPRRSLAADLQLTVQFGAYASPGTPRPVHASRRSKRPAPRKAPRKARS